MQGRLLKPETNHIQSFPKNNWEKEFKIANKNKIRLIEWIVDRKNILKNPINTKKGRSKIKKLKKIYKIQIESLTADFFLQKPFTIDKKNKNEFYIFRKTLENCAKINIKFFIVPLLETASLKKKDEKFFISKMKRLTNILKKNKQIILFETDLSLYKIQKLLSSLPKELFGINFDTGNSLDCGYSQTDIKKIIKFTHNIHLKDKNNKLLTVKLGDGLFNFKNFFKLLKNEKYEKNLILQTARTTSNQVYNILTNKRFVEKFLKI